MRYINFTPRLIPKSIVTLAFGLVLGTMLIPASGTGQVRMGLNINIGDQPAWGPVGYEHVEYYYLPDIEVYYYVPTHTYWYYEGGHWVGRNHLPGRYRDFDLYHSYKVVVNEREPYRHHERYRDMYVMYRGRRDQDLIRDSHEPRYFASKGHPEHEKWEKKEKRHGRGRGSWH